VARGFTEKTGCRRKTLSFSTGTILVTTTAFFILATAPPMFAQSSQAKATTPSFEVASIKLNRGDNNGQFLHFLNDPGRFNRSNITAKALIEFAYHVRPFQISGGPSWINSARYDIQAKVDDSVASQLEKLPQEERMEQFRLMLRSLLADRFELKLIHQTKVMPVYALVVAKGGAKLNPTTVDLTQPPSPNATAQRPGAMMTMSVDGPEKLRVRAMRITNLADFLGGQPDLGGRLVLDETGLKGHYDFTLEWAPEASAPILGDSTAQNTSNRPLLNVSGPSLFTAIQEQLGLKLEPQKGPVEILVIDHIERPSEN